MKKREFFDDVVLALLIIAIITLVVFVFKTYYSGEFKIEKECFKDSDCVKDSCCHASSCVALNKAPKCDGIYCSAECKIGTLDCGQGSCGCFSGRCGVKLS